MLRLSVPGNALPGLIKSSPEVDSRSVSGTDLYYASATRELQSGCIYKKLSKVRITLAHR